MPEPTNVHQHPDDHDCANAGGEHPCGGHGSSDGICHHEDGGSHACCQATDPAVIVSLSDIKPISEGPPAAQASEGVSCVGPDGVHPCGDHGSADGICRHDDGTQHPCGDCPDCRVTEAELILDVSAR
ncbi:MAG: hypothetical protein IIB28_07760 [Chloroflexi bacterium]|nr:hypothetical protein [Chloroflexota bacterium]